jgi:hypothetical protein
MWGHAGATQKAAAAANVAVESSRVAGPEARRTDAELPAGFFEVDAGQSEVGSAIDNYAGPHPAFSAEEALSAAASVADHSPAATSAVRGESGVPHGFFEVLTTACVVIFKGAVPHGVHATAGGRWGRGSSRESCAPWFFLERV